MPTIAKGTNVEVPAKSAGIGDIVLMNSSRAIKIIGHGTYASGSLPSGYTVYGVIYGFVNGLARVVAAKNEAGNLITSSFAYNASSNPGGETVRRAAMLASDSGSESSSGSSAFNCAYQLAASTVEWGTNTMRNGKNAGYAGMNVNSMMLNSYTGANTILHPFAAWGADQVMSKANFDALSPGGSNAKDIYGTWDNYVRQTLAVLNPGSCFMATDGDRKPHEQGKWNTMLIGPYTKSSPDANASGGGACWYPAANYCYNYYVANAGETAANHNWWLPSMHEMFDLMIDEHRDKVDTCGATTLSNRAYRWSSVRYSATYFWLYNPAGFCYGNYVYYAFTVRPVTLLKLV